MTHVHAVVVENQVQREKLEELLIERCAPTLNSRH